VRKSKSGSHYPPNWPEISKRVKMEAGNCCIRCNIPDGPGRVLTVHHLDMDRGNCCWWNLAALCQQCHLHIQAKVVMERIWFLPHSDWFKPYVAGYTAHRLGLDESKEYVMQHLNELLEEAIGVFNG
jgi:hypothetical protein